ncbi:MAG: cyclic pyranopterin monophosphate synthase MoaC [Chloroherpetonaceae bacterium]|nr:cyclic pyranopterin monophosphate synthase MoaC [Chthonomonadaceae bacterium]MDW8207059.1 cyclic pyranopterin monophosphate synthase MoaC [Chloroherpetonaceae bacterium]
MHLDDRGRARMVDVSDKAETARQALAHGRVRLRADTVALLRGGTVPKGNALEIARIAGVLAAKRTADLIPLCHPLPLTHINVELTVEDDGVQIRSEVTTVGKTGVEMEALTAVSVAALALYDMIKAIDREAVISDICLVEKSGGQSGDYHRANIP